MSENIFELANQGVDWTHNFHQHVVNQADLALRTSDMKNG